ncbi:Zinc finger protein 638 [Dissostichus eleginoides]|uniref:Zinc finger protein 638 n=1 Tax=Dissostichus eleginoides TaxID=100907 RepID=A0AAD9CLB6_DISEL|nr:Zinc finger protein 638 [Dissostichus eleginoides]
MGERGSKDAGEGKCGEVRKNSGGDQDPQKEFLMDPEIEAGDMKEEQEPQQSIEVASLQRNVSYMKGEYKYAMLIMHMLAKYPVVWVGNEEARMAAYLYLTDGCPLAFHYFTSLLTGCTVTEKPM